MLLALLETLKMATVLLTHKQREDFKKAEAKRRKENPFPFFTKANNNGKSAKH